MNAEPEYRGGAQNEPRMDQSLREQMDSLNDALSAELEKDARLASSVPVEERGEDFDFIQMSGLTRPDTEEEEEEEDGDDDDELRADADANKPLDFAEAGVRDVDSSMNPPDHVGGALEDSDIVTEMGPPGAIADLQDIIADLTKKQEMEDAAEETPSEAIDESAIIDVVMEDMEEDPPSASDDSFADHGLPEPDFPEVASIESSPSVDTASFDEPVPAPRRKQPEPSSKNRDFSEVGTLLQELQEQPRDEEPAPVAPQAPSTFYEPPPPRDPEVLQDEEIPLLQEERSRASIQDEAQDEAIYQRAQAPRGRRATARHKVRLLRRIRRMVLALLLLAIGVAGVSYGYQWWQSRFGAEETLFELGEARTAAGRYEEAADAYIAFAHMHPQHTLAGTALLNAANALRAPKPGSVDEQTELLTRAMSIIEEFLQAYPTHLKAPRATSILGIMQYERGNLEECISVLSAPELRLQDQPSALPALRALADAYIAKGETTSAESRLKQAASLPGNHYPDQDFDRLGDLYHSLGGRGSESDDQHYYTLALEQWNNALRVPGIDPARTSAIKQKRDVLKYQLETGVSPKAAPAIEAEGEAMPVAEAQEVPITEETEPLPVDSGEGTPAQE